MSKYSFAETATQVRRRQVADAARVVGDVDNEELELTEKAASGEGGWSAHCQQSLAWKGVGTHGCEQLRPGSVAVCRLLTLLLLHSPG